VLQAIGLSKSYEPGTLALAGLDLEVRPGEIYCLLGANGAGKTTTIHLFLNLLEPTAGRALICGIDVQRDPLAAKAKVAYLPERLELYGALTGRQNLEFFAGLAGRQLGGGEVKDLLSRGGRAQEAADARVKPYSKGMRQKLGIAIVLAKDAPALILDEPLSGLDPEAAALFVAQLLELRSQGRAILMSTHDVLRTKQLADRVGILKAGEKVLECSREELAQENLEQLYLDYMQDIPQGPPPGGAAAGASEAAAGAE